MPKLVIFDHDGLMVNSEEVIFAALRTIFARYGHAFAWDYYVTSVGLPVVESIAMYLRDLPIPLAVEAFTAERNALVADYFATRLEPMLGLVALLDMLRAREVPLAVATSATREHLSRNLERFGLAPYFQTAVCIDDVARGKPHPDLILEVLARTGFAPKDAIMLEDAPLGVAAARRAGVFCVAVPTRGIALARFAEADVIARDLVAVRALLEVMATNA
jgi:HAD superfamily hydrolase (TIGR01509 family)